MLYILNNKSKDCRFIFDNLRINQKFSLYYYYLIIENTDKEIKDIIYCNLVKFYNIINSNFHELFYPIEVEDAYVSGILVKNCLNKMELDYIILNIEGYAFDILNFDKFIIIGKDYKNLDNAVMSIEDLKTEIQQCISNIGGNVPF